MRGNTVIHNLQGPPRTPPGGMSRPDPGDLRGPQLTEMGPRHLSDAGFLVHILLMMLPNLSWNHFSSILKPPRTSKSTIFIKKVVNFEVFHDFFWDVLLNPFVLSFGPLGHHLGSFDGPFGDLSGSLGGSWGLLGPIVHVSLLKNCS